VSGQFPAPEPDPYADPEQPTGPAPDVDSQLEDLREQAMTDATPDRPIRHDPAPEPTGNPAVDAVLESLERLDDTPVAEHVAVFESAHERLRGALADAGEDRPQT
jgi:hypothetical protein